MIFKILKSVVDKAQTNKINRQFRVIPELYLQITSLLSSQFEYLVEWRKGVRYSSSVVNGGPDTLGLHYYNGNQQQLRDIFNMPW